MSTSKINKINQLLQLQPPGVVLLSRWLSQKGYSADLLKRYRKSQWFTSIGNGAMIRTGMEVTHEGAISALQGQLGLSIHPAGKTALALQGKTHYLEFKRKTFTLFGGSDEKLPEWFKSYPWDFQMSLFNSTFLPQDLGLKEITHNTFRLKVSSPERALMECLYLVPKHQELIEGYELMQGLNNLKPARVQALLEHCSSVKVKRLFLFLADKAGHEWFNYLDVKSIDLGKGKRSIIKRGAYIPEYKITVNKELSQKDESSL